MIRHLNKKSDIIIIRYYWWELVLIGVKELNKSKYAATTDDNKYIKKFKSYYFCYVVGN